MSKSIEKAACGEPMPPTMDPVQVPPMPGMASDSQLDAILSKLDGIAMKLENNGMVRLAEEVDQISNSIGLIKNS